MISKETIEELKKSHPELWQQKRAVLDEQQTAQVILAQIEHDKQHPPHLEDVAAARRLIVMVNNKGAEFQRLKADVIERVKALGEHAELIDVEFISAAEDGDVTGLNKLLEEHRELVARQSERIKELEAEADLKAERILQLEAELKAAQAALEAASKKKK